MDQPSENGVQLPMFAILWDAEHQVVHLRFETSEFKTWEFALGILEMAKVKVEENRKFVQMMKIQQAAQQQQQAAALVQEIELGRG